MQPFRVEYTIFVLLVLITSTVSVMSDTSMALTSAVLAIIIGILQYKLHKIKRK